MSGSASFHRRAAGFGLGAALVSGFGQSFFIGMFGAPVQSALGLHSAQWGALYGLATGASGLLMFWLGALADRVATRRAITIALTVLACGTVLMATAQAPWMLLLGFFCLRLGGQGLCGHLAIVTAARHALMRGRSIATAAFGFILGEAMLPLVVTALLGWIDWRWVWACAGALVLLVALPTLRRIAAPLPLELPSPLSVPAPAAMARRRLLRQPAFLAALPVMLTLPFVVTSVFLHQGALSAARGWTLTQVAMGILAFALIQAGTTWISGRWIDRYGARGIFRFYLWPLAVGMLLGRLCTARDGVVGSVPGHGHGLRRAKRAVRRVVGRIVRCAATGHGARRVHSADGVVHRRLAAPARPGPAGRCAADLADRLGGRVCHRHAVAGGALDPPCASGGIRASLRVH